MPSWRASAAVGAVDERARASFSKSANVRKWSEIYARDDEFFAYAMQVRRALVLEAVEEDDGFRRGVLLDAGCGAGGVSAELARRGYSIIALDFSLEMARAAREALGENRVVVADVRHLPFANESIANAISIGVLGYLPDLRLAAQDLRRVLRPGGAAIVAARNRWELSRALDLPTSAAWLVRSLLGTRRRGARRNKFFNRRYPARRLARLLARSGFEIRRLGGGAFGPLSFAGRALLPHRVSVRISGAIDRAARSQGLRWLQHLGLFVLVLGRKA
jgi:SAM-dependent methyltransferase